VEVIDMQISACLPTTLAGLTFAITPMAVQAEDAVRVQVTNETKEDIYVVVGHGRLGKSVKADVVTYPGTPKPAPEGLIIVAGATKTFGECLSLSDSPSISAWRLQGKKLTASGAFSQTEFSSTDYVKLPPDDKLTLNLRFDGEFKTSEQEGEGRKDVELGNKRVTTDLTGTLRLGEMNRIGSDSGKIRKVKVGDRVMLQYQFDPEKEPVTKVSVRYHRSESTEVSVVDVFKLEHGIALTDQRGKAGGRQQLFGVLLRADRTGECAISVIAETDGGRERAVPLIFKVEQ
jgi:hypothetical protein